MSTPQLENGYTRIANELLEAVFRANFNGSQIRVILCLLRNTYGYGRKECEFSNTYISDATGINKKNVAVVVKSLVDGKVLEITQASTFNSARRVAINKNYTEWECISPQWKNTPTGSDVTISTMKTPSEGESTTPTGSDITTSTGGDVTTQKRKNIKKEYKEMYEHFFEKAWDLYPKKRGKASVSAKAKRELYNAGIDVVTAAIEKYKQEIAGTDEQYVLYGSTFFNSRWKDYIPETDETKTRATELSISEDEPAIDLWEGDEYGAI